MQLFILNETWVGFFNHRFLWDCFSGNLIFSCCVHTRLLQIFLFSVHVLSSWFSVWCCRAKIVCSACFYLCWFCGCSNTKLWLTCYDFPWTKKVKIQTRGYILGDWIIKEARQVKEKWELLRGFRIMWPHHLGEGRKDPFMKKFNAVSSYQNLTEQKP